jgi:putative peptidoglycan lipid II flippase
VSPARRSRTRWHLFVSISCTLISRFLGFIRTIVETSLLGLTSITDCYQGAFRLTNFFREVFAEGALGGVYTPLHTRAVVENSEEEATNFFWATVLTVLIVSSLLVVILYVGLKPILSFWLMDFSSQKVQITMTYAQIMLPFLTFISVGSMFMVGHYLKGRFVYSSLHPILFSLAVIGFGLANPGGNLGISLSWGVLVGGVLQFLLLATTLRPGLPSIEGLSRQMPRIKLLLSMLFPVLIAVAIHRINRLIDLQFASGLVAGTLSALAYSMVILNVPMGLVSIASSNVFYPLLARLKSEGKLEEYHYEITRALRFLLLLGIPLTIFFTMYSLDLVQFLFLKIPGWIQISTQMEETSVVLMADALRFYSPGLLFIVINPLLVKIFHSSLETRVPAVLGSLLVLFNILINMLLTPLFAHKGIAAATSICAFLHSIFLIRCLWLTKTYKLERKVLASLSFYTLLAFPSYYVSSLLPSSFTPLPEFLLGSLIYFLLFFSVQWIQYGSFSWPR